MAGVRIQQLSKRYGRDKHAVVSNFQLEIQDKEFIVFVGPSGCGKSTTLRMIAGLEDISEGEIYIGDRLVNKLPPKDRDISMVFQNYALYPNLTVYENIAFGLRMRKLPKHEIDLAVKNASRVLEIEPYLYRKPKELSGGQRQRVALGRAIVRNPQLFLMDEPLSNLDAKLRATMRLEITKLHKKLGTTFIFVTHDQVEAMTMADRIVVMKDGVIQQCDTPELVYSRPANTFVAAFIGSPSINFIHGKITENPIGRLEFHTSKFVLKVTETIEGVLRRSNQVNKSVILGIRPEHVKLEGLFSETIITGIYKDNELMGADRFLYLDIGQEKLLIARVDPDNRFTDNERVKLELDLSKALFFNKETGERFVE
ncbi:sn-glycerol-3-phosphate ABC transporter ATP-binding protein UgpC [Paenibacillus sp. GSMTC-2017]|uniref:ABC transporter ATP-binding protein n=1 Tax=Paenibacillus sp. GSMTC-2017 TaxID=2794350 RepID=UPI0018D88B41|nr:sn-glycerol-3-phosphate ABC transporter ATP-binding protein UgpC [Paenibacillus sp. GSMTC-2017]MBH5317427.1 sn-glycerol-3-phosphate ABC transporter ATP-binding protein UgpC [Paenibacillus sp. GSMTC-2017]